MAAADGHDTVYYPQYAHSAGCLHSSVAALKASKAMTQCNGLLLLLVVLASVSKAVLKMIHRVTGRATL